MVIKEGIMKKVGIVTLYAGQNFGNKLQNYAVEQMCLQNGFVPTTFKYEISQKPVAEKKGLISKLTIGYLFSYVKHKLNSRCHIKNSDTSILKQFNYWKKNRCKIENLFKLRVSAYNIFDYKNLHYSNRVIKLSESDSCWTENYAMFLSGSDQVWNPYYQSVNEATFLRFVPEWKRASIAGSFGVSVIPDDRKETFSNWLKEFRFLSVREEAGAKIIKDLCDREAVVLADPTMVVNREVWDNLATKPKFETPSKYILTYFLGDRTKEYRRFIDGIKKQHNFEVVNLLDIMQPQYLACDPAEFVYLVKNASFICTDSFHATVFSILYKVPFVTFDRVEGKRSMGSRIDTLLKYFDFQDRKYENIKKNISRSFEIDFDKADESLIKLKQDANRYLKEVFLAANENSVTTNKKQFNVYETDDCTGCGACVAVCPTKALLFAEKKGFLYPQIQTEKCVYCGKCSKICPVEKGVVSSRIAYAYAMRSVNDNIVLNSSSGGVITSICEAILKAGVVYGASFDDDFVLKHIRVDELSDLERIRKSKYVQSEIIHCFDQINKDLNDGKKVLFIGTPCQVAAVKSVVGEHDNLITVDIVCHGVPSPGLWR